MAHSSCNLSHRSSQRIRKLSSAEPRMRVLMTGHNGYIGSVMSRVFREAGHDVTGLDTFLFETCTLGHEEDELPAIRVDLRDVDPEQLQGFDAVVHLAALCNDPLGNLN